MIYGVGPLKPCVLEDVPSCVLEGAPICGNASHTWERLVGAIMDSRQDAAPTRGKMPLPQHAVFTTYRSTDCDSRNHSATEESDTKQQVTARS